MRSGLVRCDQIHSASLKWMFEDGGAPPAASISLCHRAGFGIESLCGDEGAGLFRGGQSVAAAEVEGELVGHWSRPFQWRGEDLASNFGSESCLGRHEW